MMMMARRGARFKAGTRGTLMPIHEKAALMWSGGKDSCLALHHVLHHDLNVRVVKLLTCVSEAYDRVSMHGVRRRLIVDQADALELPVEFIVIPHQDDPACPFAAPRNNPGTTFPPNDLYSKAMLAAFQRLKEAGVDVIVSGDIYLEDLRAYRDQLFSAAGLAGCYPLWGLSSSGLFDEFIALGYRAVIVCVDTERLPEALCGKELDASFKQSLAPELDPCGERGEYHSFAFDGPQFRRPVEFCLGDVHVEAPFAFQELFASRALRTVSMLPAATEIVGALGLLDQLVAVSHECDYPEEAKDRPRVTYCEIHGKAMSSSEIDRWVSEQIRTNGTIYALDDKALRELGPDLILTQRLCDVCAPGYESVEALAATLPSRPRVMNLEPKSLRDVLSCVEQVAKAMGHPEKGVELCCALGRRIAHVVERVSDQPRPTAFVMEWADPIYNSGHWNPELVRLAGGIAVLSPEGAYSTRVSWEKLRTADPEVLVIAWCGQKIDRTMQDLPILEALEGWHGLKAVRKRRTFLADGSAYFSRPGPRLVDTLEMLACVLHPEALNDEFRGRGILKVY
jgi:iron complex transport system substrate-binding protein